MKRSNLHKTAQVYKMYIFGATRHVTRTLRVASVGSYKNRNAQLDKFLHCVCTNNELYNNQIGGIKNA